VMRRSERSLQGAGSASGRGRSNEVEFVERSVVPDTHDRTYCGGPVSGHGRAGS
jgi:hypothetical protein